MAKRKILKSAISEETLEIIASNFNCKPDQCDMKIRDLDEDLNSGDLIIDYDYQRGYLYEKKPKEASKFVESVFMGLVIPEIQLFEDVESQKKELIDGQQRVLSLVRFLRNEYPLKGLENLTELEGCYYKDLSPLLQKAFKNYTVKGRVVNRDHSYKYEMFERLNTGAKSLTSQEIRNCVFHGKMINLAKRLANDPHCIQLFYGLDNTREEITELVLRFLSLIYNDGYLIGGYSACIKKFLTSEYSKTISDKDVERLYVRFLSTVKLINSAFDLKSLFKEISSEGKYPKAHIEAIFVPIYLLNDKHSIQLNSDFLFSKIEECMKDNKKYLNTVFNNSAVNTPKEVNTRIAIIKNLIETELATRDTKTDNRRLFTVEDKKMLWEKQLNSHGKVSCALCGNKIHDISQCEVDHIIPWSKGGKTVLSNGQLTHISCNRKKLNHLN